MATKLVTMISYLTIQPGTEQIVLDRFDALVAQTRAEPGCICYDLHQHESERHRFVFYEIFADQAAVDVHLSQPYIQEWIEHVRVNGGNFDVERWTILSQPDHANSRYPTA